MKYAKPARTRALSILMMGLLVLPATAPAAERELSSAVGLNEPWVKSIEVAQQGDFDKATEQINKIAAEGDLSPKASAWLHDWLAAESARMQLTAADEQKYVEWAQKWHKEGKYPRALGWAYQAMLNSTDKDAFRESPWLTSLREDAMAEAAGLREEHEWKDAHAIYYSLSLIFEDDKQIDDLRQQMLEQARVDEVYKEDTGWRDQLEGIDPKMVEDALWRIDQKYVEEADFKTMMQDGYKMLLLLADSPSLAEQFPSLSGDRGREYSARIERKLDQIGRTDSLSYREAKLLFRRALDINKETVQLPQELVVREYMDAALQGLDEFTSMIWPYDFAEFEKHTRGDFIGVGIQIRNKYNPDLKDNEILVVTPLEDTPAYRAGIQANDVITAVNGKPLLGVLVTKAVNMITGPLGTEVTLTIRRTLDSGKEVTMDVPLKREVINIQSVKSAKRLAGDEEKWDYMLDPEMHIAYIRIGSFQENTIDQLREALSQAKAQGMRGLILDLRFDPGGLLKAAVEVAELFLGKGDRIVSTRGLRSAEWPIDAERNGPYKDLPLIVLTNESSASASEIVAGALQDHKRAITLGERTFGKFSVQNLIQLMHSDAHLKLTTARYYLPSGRSLHREKGSKEWGVAPNVEVPIVPKELAKIIYMRRDAEVIGAVKTHSEDEIDEPMKPRGDDTAEDATTNGANATTQAAEAEDAEQDETDENNRPNRDPQLDTALLIMRLHLLDDQSGQIAAGTPAVPATEGVSNN